MSRQSRVMQVLEEMLDSKSTAEEACADCPELLPMVKTRWAQLHEVEEKLNSLFPAPNARNDNQAVGPLSGRPNIPGYDIGQILGRGAVGVVYKARHLKLNRDVALKMLLSGMYASTTELKRFAREAETIASLRHPNFVQVYDVGDLDGCPYFTMEFVEGGNLAQKLDGVPIPSSHAAALSIILADAIQAAHAGGIIHRDLKPSNIMLTADGIPKISDFGLARRVEGSSDLTNIGDRVGTPCYMAPEQARGQGNAVGSLADVYSVGAILYEMLTGRPPFQSETPGETERQLLTSDPVPPSKLNTKVPRDLETVCLKCLHQDPQRRYSSAGALADDLRRFGRGEAIMARPVGGIERGVKWVRRHPTASIATIAIVFFIVAGVSSGLWIFAQRLATARALDDDLKQVQALEAQSEWDDARLAQERVKARLTATTPASLRSRADQNDKDLGTVLRLDAIRRDLSGKEIYITWGVLNNGFNNLLQSDPQYEAAFRDAGLGSPEDSVVTVAAKIKSSNIRNALLDALYDWVGSSDNQNFHKWILNVAMLTDPAPTAWAVRAQDSKTWNEKTLLTKVLNTAPANPGCLRLTVLVAARLQDVGGNGIPYLKKLQRQHPGDFRTNFTLAWECINAHQLNDAIRFAQAAVALRRDYPILNNNIGIALLNDGRAEDAVDQFRICAASSPDAAIFQLNLGGALSQAGRYAESVAVYRRGFDLGGERSANTAWYAVSLDGTGHVDEAVDEFKQLVAKTPSVIHGLYTPLPSFIRQGRAETMRAAWQQGLETNGGNTGDYDGYAEFSLFLGKENEYRHARSILLAHFGGVTNPRVAETIGRACLLLPATPDQTRIAAQLIDRAVNAKLSASDEWATPYFLFAKALAEYRQGRYASALVILRGGDAGQVLGPCPQLVMAMSQFKLGNTTEAMQAFKTAIRSFDWSPTNAVNKEAWIYHTLRREAESMLLPYLPAFAAGNYQPRNNVERLCLMGYCQDNGLNLTLARLYRDAFEQDPALAGKTTVDYRYRAACAAALTGCGQGKDAGALSNADRKQWRGQALVWLQTDLDDYERSYANNATTLPTTSTALTDWHSNPDLTGVRDAVKLQSLDPEERDQWSKLWIRVKSLNNLERGGKK